MVMIMHRIDQVDAKKALPPPRQSREDRDLTQSVTRREIERFWRRKRIEEEDHLLSAIKAAARHRARSFTEDYRRFEESLNEASKTKAGHAEAAEANEIRVGIKDWWTKSKYAYLNQPATDSSTPKEVGSLHMANTLCFYKPPPSPLFPSSPLPLDSFSRFYFHLFSDGYYNYPINYYKEGLYSLFG